MAPTLSRRALLKAGAGVAALGTTGYAGARVASRTGTVVVRHVTGHHRERGGLADTVDVAHAELHRDGTVDREVHADYRDRLDPGAPLVVSNAVHRALRERFDGVRYYLGHRCPDADCSTPAVSRGGFNGTRLGETVELLYHGSTATVVPA
jgi:hypothetical protein